MKKISFFASCQKQALASLGQAPAQLLHDLKNEQRITIIIINSYIRKNKLT
jgi:hypothetical protein